jgi:hypothetical protein
MSRKAIFDIKKAKALLKERDGIDIYVAKVAKEAKESGVSERSLYYYTKGKATTMMLFMLDFCNKHNLTIQDVITIKEE